MSTALLTRLAWRNLWRHRRRTVIVALAIGLTTALMILYRGLMSGFDQAIYGNAIKVLGGNIQVHAPGYAAHPDERPLLPVEQPDVVHEAASSFSQVLAVSRRINTSGMATSRHGALGVGIVGIEPDAELPVSLIGQRISQGRFLTPDDGDAIVIGQGLADALELGLGDRLTLVGRAEHEQMRQRSMTVVGIFDLDMAEVEKATLYMPLATAQSLYMAPGEVTEAVVWLRDMGHEATVIRALAPRLAGYEVASWRVNFPELAQTMAIKGAVMDVFGIIMLGIAGIGTLNLLLMAVYERTREIGVLAALGLKARQITLLFLLEGSLLGLLGALAGVALGLLGNALLSRVGLDFSQFTQMTEFTALIDGRVYSTLALNSAPRYILSAVLISILASLYPAREAARREPAAALHFL